MRLPEDNTRAIKSISQGVSNGITRCGGSDEREDIHSPALSTPSRQISILPAIKHHRCQTQLIDSVDKNFIRSVKPLRCDLDNIIIPFVASINSTGCSSTDEVILFVDRYINQDSLLVGELPNIVCSRSTCWAGS